MKILAQIESDTTPKQYQIRVGEDFRTYCTCPSWRFSKADPKACKHLVRFMCGDFDFVDNVPVDRHLDVDFQDDGFSLRAILLD